MRSVQKGLNKSIPSFSDVTSPVDPNAFPLDQAHARLIRECAVHGAEEPLTLAKGSPVTRLTHRTHRDETACEHRRLATGRNRNPRLHRDARLAVTA